MDLRILEIASNTENNKILDKHTHKSKNKNPICGDEMEISLIIKNNKVIETITTPLTLEDLENKLASYSTFD